MTWATPPTFTPGQVLIAASLNIIRDDLNESAAAKATTQGDTFYATGANALARLAKGTAGQVLRMNSGATAPEWGGYSVPSGGIIMWSGTIANIPSGWLICDGNNGTPNLLAKFVKGVATAGTDPGATGGAATHSHTAHTAVSGDASMAAEGVLTLTPVVNSKTHSTENHEPAYYAVAFIMKS